MRPGNSKQKWSAFKQGAKMTNIAAH